MRVPVADRAWRQFRADVRADPYLPAILLVALALAGVGFWHGIPNFATWDARDRLLDPLAVYGHVLADPSIGSLREGVAWSREPFGATLYLYGIALVPVVLAAAVVGSLDAIAAIPGYESDLFSLWQATPRWVWVWGIALARLLNVALAVGCVYLTYRLGVTLYGRRAGRLAAFLLSITFGFLMLAHEVGEDVPALFALLLALYLLVRYVQTGAERRFYEGCAAGGLAVAFKLTSGLVVPLVGVAFLLRAVGNERPWLRALWRPRLLLGGALLGALAIVVGFPTALVGRLDLFAERFLGHTGQRVTTQVGPDAPVWWWFLRGYLHVFGLPLFVATLVGVTVSIARLRHRRSPGVGVVLALLGLYLLLYAGWAGVRAHHLLPTVPLALLLLAGVLARFLDARPRLARPLVALLLVSTAVYAGVGAAGYASTPRDAAGDWLAENVPANATMETYRWAFDEGVLAHSVTVSRPARDEDPHPCPAYIQLTYRDLLYLQSDLAERRPPYAQSNRSERARYIGGLLDGEYAYDTAAEFGPRPPGFVPQRPEPGSVRELLWLGIEPRSDQYGDEQDLGVDQYTVVLERTGRCEGSRQVPF